MTRFLIAWVALAAWAVAAFALTVDVTYGYRQVHEGWSQPPAEFAEGGVVATFTADAPVDTLLGADGLEQLSAWIWTYTFAWDAADSLTVVFEEAGGGDTAVVRALPGWPTFVPGQHGAPVITLDGDPASLWEPVTGIYVWGEGSIPNWDQRGEQWEREFDLRWWNADGTLRHQRPVGVRINGNWSRNYVQKSLRLYFDHHGEPNDLVDDVFGDGVEEFEHLILRCGSRHANLYIYDPLAVEVLSALGHPVSRWTPIEAYLNGEYWGLYHLRERPDRPWAERTLGLDGDFVLVKDTDGLEPDHFARWENYLADVGAITDPADNTFFEQLDATLDLDSYLDWVLFQIWSASADNGGQANLVVYQPEGGRWHFMAYDQDAMFHGWNRTIDYFRFFTAATQAEFDAWKPPAFYQPFAGCNLLFGLFRQTVSNARGRRLLREHWQELRNQHLDSANSTAVIADIVAASLPSQADHHERWQMHALLAWYQSELVTYIASRNTICDDDFAAFMDAWMDPVELDVFTATAAADGAHLAWHTERETDLVGWIVSRRAGEPDAWVDIATYTTDPELTGAGGPHQPASYAFFDPDAIPGQPFEYRLSYVDGGGHTEIKPWVEAVNWPVPPPNLVINEFLASNDAVIADETGAFEDWVEIHNPSPEPVSLAGLYLTDDLAVPLKWAFPSDLSIAAGGHLLVWCDDDELDGPLHASFKLSAGGEDVGLYLEDNGQPVAVDSYTFGPQVTDISEGRLPDGGPDWQFFSAPTPGASNVATAAPGAATVLTLTAWPNPFNPACRLAFTLPAAGETTLEIYDLAGRRVRRLVAGLLNAGAHTVTWRGVDDRGAALPSGVYYARVRAEADQRVRKLTLIR